MSLSQLRWELDAVSVYRWANTMLLEWFYDTSNDHIIEVTLFIILYGPVAIFSFLYHIHARLFEYFSQNKSIFEMGK